ncbi:MAG: class I SAM-dependent methyltransferase [Candidatus Woykebacteria bacterium]
MDQSKLYTDLANIYDLFYQKHFNYPKVASLIDQYLKKYRAKKVLHVGSGPGRLTKILSQKNKYDVQMLDSSKEMIELSHKLLPKIPQTLADMRDFHLSEEFDAVILAGRAFPHLLTDEDISEALEKFHDSLKPQGILIFDTFFADKMLQGELYPEIKKIKIDGIEIARHIKTKIVSYDPPITNLAFSFKAYDNGEARFYDVEHLVRGFSQEDVKKLLEENGFEVLEFAPGLDEVSYFTIARAA